MNTRNTVRLDQSETRGTYVIPSDTSVVIGRGVEIRASDRLEDYVADDSLFRDTRGTEMGRALFFANGAENIELIGEEGSLLNGRGHLWKAEGKRSQRPSILRFVNCRNVTLRGLNLIDSAAWCVHLLNCETVRIEGLTIRSHANSNNDGLDLDCCRDVHVTGCTIDTGDDAVVLKSTRNLLSENILVESCEIRTHWAGFKIGTETVGDIRNVSFVNNRILRSEGGTVKIFSCDGSRVENVHIKDLYVAEGTGPVFIVNGNRMRTYFQGETRLGAGHIRNVTIENMEAHVYVDERPHVAVCRGVVFASGSEEERLAGLTLRHCTFHLPGGVEEGVDLAVRELGGDYPEFYKLGTAPAYGAYVRHADGVRLEDVAFLPKEADTRPKIVTEDVTAFTES